MDLPQIKTEGDRMQIRIGPAVVQYAILAGLVSLGVGATYFGSDYFSVKLMYILACFTLGVSFLQNWEECIFDKNAKILIIRQSSFYQRFFRFKKLRDVEIELNDIVSVLVKTIKMKDLSNNHSVDLLLRSGISLPLMESFKSDSRSYCDALAEKIRRFLNISHMELLQNHSNYENYILFNNGDSSSGASGSDSSDVEDLASSGQMKESVSLVSEVR